MTPAATATGTTAAAKTSGSRKLLAKYGTIPTYPSLINWVNAGKVLPAPGFQAACGSSWAFAAAGALESKLMIDSKLNTTAALSPQHIMVCSRGVGCTDWGGVSSSRSSLGRPQEAHHPMPPLPLTLQDCTARMFAYTDSTCNGGSLTDAFQYAAERGVTADDGEWELGRIWGRRKSSVRGRCLLACLPCPSPPACRVLQTHRSLPAHLPPSPPHPTPPHPCSLPLPLCHARQRRQCQGLPAAVRPRLPHRPRRSCWPGAHLRHPRLQASVARQQQGGPDHGAGRAARRHHPGRGRLVPALCWRHLDHHRLR